MTKDLEDTLAGLGPGYRDVVSRLVAAYEPMARVSCDGASDRCAVSRTARASGWGMGYLVAASLLVLLGFAALLRSPSAVRQSDSRLVYTVAYAPTEESLRQIVASQRADGSWANDFITQQNASALRGSSDLARIVSYKKAVRYLRSKGLRPLTDEELRQRADIASRTLARM